MESQSEQEFFIKATLTDRLASYGSAFNPFYYKMGENVHPDSDLSSKVCSRGFHLARTIGDAIDYVSYATEFYLAIVGKILGSDDAKVRSDRCNLLMRIPQGVMDSYNAECKQMADGRNTELRQLLYAYEVKSRRSANTSLRLKWGADYDSAKRKLMADYYAKRKPIEKAYLEKVIKLWRKN